MNNHRYVYIEPECFTTLITSAIEVYNRETNGFLIGKVSQRKIRGRMKYVISLEIASPFQLEERKPTSVTHENREAFNRLIDSLSVMKSNLIGGYHSHPFPNDTTELSKGDVEFVLEEMNHINRYARFELHEWLEIIISIKKREYATRQTKGELFKKIKNGIGILVRSTPYVGFNIKIKGHWLINTRKKIQRIPARLYIQKSRIKKV